jgi:DNA-binding CsgD family transcriptional regulator/N-acetylneuraminic acid mutarotase
MSRATVEPLSERELELVRLLSRGLSNKEIARELYISPNTVKVHLRNIYAKLNVSSRTEAMVAAVRLGWVEIEGAGDGRAVPAGDAVPETAAFGEVPAKQAVVEPPLAGWQRVYLVVSVLLVVLGVWLVWPSEAEPSEPFTDRRPLSSRWNPSQVLRWQGLAQLPTPRSRLAVVADGGRIYAIAGDTVAGVSNVVEIYVPEEDVWVRGADKLTAVANVGAAAIGGRVFVPGGSTDDGGVSDRLEVYDPGAGSDGVWSVAQPMPQGASAYAIAVHEDKLYLFGGWNGSVYLPESYRYDPGQDRWVALSSMPTPRAFAGAGVIGGHIYVIGGFDGQTELDACKVYDPGRDTWETCPPMHAPRGGIGAAVIADTLYVVGGGWKSYLVENEYFSPDEVDPSQGIWRTFPSPLLQEWRNLGVVSNGTFLYAIGGWDGDYAGVNQAYRALYRLYLPRAMGQGSSSSEE